MNIINTLLSLLFGILAGLILVFGLIVMFCILLFSTRLTVTFGETKMVTIFEKAAVVTEFVKPSPVTKPEATHLVIEFDKAELLAKLAKEIAPNYSVISVKNKTWTGILVKVFYGTLQMPSAVESTDTSEISKSKEAEIHQSSEE
ncbi:unnamed protein product [Lepidochelys olivacea]